MAPTVKTLFVALMAAATVDAAANTTVSDMVPRICRHNPAGPLRPGERDITCRAAADLLDASKVSSYYPWTHSWECAPSTRNKELRHQYCAFTRDDLHGSQGLIVMTMAHIAADLGHIMDERNPQWTRMPPPEPLPEYPPYNIAYIDDKGLGVVANTTIPKGTVFMRDSAAMIKLADRPESLDRDEAAIITERAFVKLPLEERMKILGLARNMGGQRLDDIFRTNAFRVRFNGAEHQAVFKEVARINHDCKPNAVTRWSNSRLQMDVIAYRDIKPGEEISLSYAPLNILSDDRADLIMGTWGFQCKCALCEDQTGQHKSDSRRRQIDRILEEMSMPEVRTLQLVTDLEDELEELLDEEGLDAQRGDLYGIISRAHSELGDLKGALKVAEKGAGLQEHYKGWDDFRTFQAKRFVEWLKMRIRMKAAQKKA